MTRPADTATYGPAKRPAAKRPAAERPATTAATLPAVEPSGPARLAVGACSAGFIADTDSPPAATAPTAPIDPAVGVSDTAGGVAIVAVAGPSVEVRIEATAGAGR